MSKWTGCPVISCKNDKCHKACQALRKTPVEDIERVMLRVIVEGRGTCLEAAYKVADYLDTRDGQSGENR